MRKNWYVFEHSVDVDLSSTNWALPEAALTAWGPPDGLYVGLAAGGTVVGTLAANTSAATYSDLAGGMVHPLSFKAFTRTGTTAGLQTSGILKVVWSRR